MSLGGPGEDAARVRGQQTLWPQVPAHRQHTGAIRSIYRWNGEICDDREIRVALHTRLSLVSTIIERVQAEHSYDVPCVLALPVLAGHRDYLVWVIESTIDPPRDQPL